MSPKSFVYFWDSLQKALRDIPKKIIIDFTFLYIISTSFLTALPISSNTQGKAHG